MRKVPYAVSVVLDHEFGQRLRTLLEEGPIWAVDSPIKRDVARMLWTEFPDRDHLEGITVFRIVAQSTPQQTLIEEINTIEEHHPAYTVIRVIGCELDSAVEQSLAEFGFDSFNRTADGFEARRPLPPPLGE